MGVDEDGVDFAWALNRRSFAVSRLKVSRSNTFVRSLRVRRAETTLFPFRLDKKRFPG